MGRVYAAVLQGEGFEKRVAIKVLRPGLEGDDLLRRFRAERRILSSLDHPYIATLIDGGTTEDGRPYVVMEYIDGPDIVRYGKDLELRARLELFGKVCAAVGYAHQHLVVHRDIKPSNILVTPDGDPKLLDFGIAKLLDDELEGVSLARTGTGMSLFTPEYASPEQVRAEPITTSTDVYSLGALLYELLTGARVYSFETLRAAEVERTITQVTPSPPSQKVAELLGNRKRSRELRGDLDTIVLMALRKEPERRYRSVADLAEDIQRYLDGLPITARKDTLSYRTLKFARRHALVVATAVAFVLLTLGFGIGMAIQARRTAEQRDIAQREAAVAREVSEFLIDLFEVSDPNESAGNEIKARSLLDRGAHQIASQLGSGPLVRATLMDTMGRAYRALGLFESASPLIETAFELRAGDPAARAQSAKHLGEMRFLEGRYAEAEKHLRESVEQLLEVFPGDRHEVAEAQASLASFLRSTGKLNEALELANTAHETLLALYGEAHRAVANSLAGRAATLEALGRFDEAESQLIRARDLRRELFGHDHPYCARSARDLGTLYHGMGRFEESITFWEEALRIDREAVGDDHPDIDNDLYGLASVVYDMGDLDRAEELYLQLLERDTERYGDHPYVALDMGNLGNLYSSRGDFEQAIEWLEKSLEMQRHLLDDEDLEIATTLSNIGGVYQRWRKLDLAEAHIRDALERRRRVLPEGHPTLLTSINMLGVVQFSRGDMDAAEAAYTEVLEAREAKLGEHPETAGSYYSLAVVQNRRGDRVAAAQLAERSVEMYRAVLPQGNIDTARAMNFLGRLLVKAEPERAVELLREAVTTREDVLLPDHTDLAHSRANLALSLVRLGELDEAQALFEAAYDVLGRRIGLQHPETVAVRDAFAAALESVGEIERARTVRSGAR